MKSNKGFTLIELLAVIVILAIIALIATPIILGVIDTAKKGSAEASALAYVKAVEDQIVIGQVTGEVIDIPSTGEQTYTVDQLPVEVKGAKPEANSSLVIDSKGEVKSACLVIKMDGKNTYNVTYPVDNGAKVEATQCTPAAASTPSEPSPEASQE